jgi:hypothetical protein
MGAASIRTIGFFIAAWAALSLSVVVAPATAAVSIAVTPPDPLVDQRLDVAVSGLRPHVRVWVTARSRAQDGLWWRSRALFRSDEKGRIDLSAQAPLSGAYRGVDGMGLFWSMSPDDEPKSADHGSFALEDFSRPIETVVEVADAGGVIASATVERRYALAGVRAVAVRQGIVGVLYAPGDGKAHPGVLVIGGSDGGPGAPGVAMLLASHGFSALSLSYFGEPGLPPTLEGVPMEYFERALRWMRHQSSVDPRSVAIYAESRGTEPGLTTAASDPGVSAVVARSPSFVLWGGVTASHLPGKAAWTLNGRPAPYIANTLYPDFVLTFLWDRLTGTPVRQTPLFLEDLARFGDTARVEIPVERIRGPVMLLAGADDQIWPSTLMAGRLMARLRRNSHPYPDLSLTYANVGHPIPFAYMPQRGRRAHAALAVGGAPEGAAAAQADAWPRIVRFLTDAAARATGGAAR